MRRFLARRRRQAAALALLLALDAVAAHRPGATPRVGRASLGPSRL